MVEVNSVIRVGHDTNTGAPVYNVNPQNFIKVKSMPKELFKKTKGKQPSEYQ